jgi:hypothetical protein
MVEAWENVTEDIKMAAQLYVGYYKQIEHVIKTVQILGSNEESHSI